MPDHREEPTEPGWYRALVPLRVRIGQDSRQWVCLEVVLTMGRLYARHEQLVVTLGFPIRWGGVVLMPEIDDEGPFCLHATDY